MREEDRENSIRKSEERSVKQQHQRVSGGKCLQLRLGFV